MPMFYFNVHDDDVTMDAEGTELASLQAAHAYAIMAARSLAAETVSKGHLVLNHRVEIQDADDRSVGTVTFGEAVDVRLE